LSKDNKQSVFQAAGFLMATMVISRILGYLRDVVLYNMFGQNRITDAYNAAFSIPDFLYSILVGGALSSAFIPIFSYYIARGEEEEAWTVASIVISWITVLLGIGLVICYAFTPQLIGLLVPGFDAKSAALTVTLTRIMLVQVVFMGLCGVSMGILHSFKHFTTPAIGSVFYNLGIVLGGSLLAAPIEARWPGYGIAAFSVGVVLGAIANFMVQAPVLYKKGINFHFNLDYHHPGFRQLIYLMIPIFIGLSVSQINLFVTQNLASSLSDGMIAALRMGQRFMQLPIGIFAIAIAMAVFPTLTSHAALNEMDEFKKHMSLGVRSVIFITLPSAVGLAVLREPIIRLMFEFKGGEFTAAATTAAGNALLFYSIGLVGYSVVHVLIRSFYALKDTRTSVIIGIVSIGINIVCSLLLIGPLEHRGLALAYSIAGISQALLLLYFLRRKIGHIDIRNMANSLLKTAGICAVMGIVSLKVCDVAANYVDIGSKFGQVAQLGVAMVIAIAIYFGLAYVIKMEEARIVFGMFGSRLKFLNRFRKKFS